MRPPNSTPTPNASQPDPSCRVLVTGGAGFIGSHTCVALAAAGFEPVIVDNFCNSDRRVLGRLEEITGRPVAFHVGDVRDRQFLDGVFAQRPIQAVVHFAGLKAVGESVSSPLRYYDTNVNGTMVLASAMEAAAVRTLIFSSSATVYGEPAASPVSESAACRPESPYGRSKWMVEQMLTDLCRARGDWQIALLRYFNPVGAHSSGRLGEQPQGVPNNLMPYLCQVATGQRAQLVIHGADYPTEDGTGVRDYIHVMDLAEGHVAALRRARQQCGVMTLNLGTGQGASVLEVVTAFERACGRPLARSFGPRRAGDVPAYWADVALAERSLHWRARRGLDDMCMDSWRWQSRNPQGYASPASQALVG